jgi:H+-translocating NAD(P) transhydrogenase subunit beta
VPPPALPPSSCCKDVPHTGTVSTLMVLGAIIGSIAFSGSCVAYAKLQG